jgi:hypothetical protein
VAMGSSSHYFVCSCYESVLSWVYSVLCKVVELLSREHFHSVSDIALYMSVYASFMCSLFFTDYMYVCFFL